MRWSREQPTTVSSPSLLFRLSHAGFIRPSVRSSSLLRLRSPCSSRTCPAAPLVWRPLCLLACRVWQVIFQQIVAISDGTGCRTGRLDADAQAHHLRVGLRRFQHPTVCSDPTCLLALMARGSREGCVGAPLPSGVAGGLSFILSRTLQAEMDRGGCEEPPLCRGLQQESRGAPWL